ncbi:serine/threonine protein kinase [Hyalangium minutum]|uniref:Protein kinase domain-containing protein n=1 Tax=Hyalangium minutum TaxID=394096 RepID=A0A085WWM5_9BACT|nr:serine/threonine-protein kinase [Hyalangium minutum]KFE72088.1 hypothetical protein DB31_0349 [Hyalangium minutum]
MSDDDVTAADPHPPVHGSIVGAWLILERLDSGTFGVVFRACRAGHPESPPVALKMAKSPWDARFERESEVLEEGGPPSMPRFEDRGLWTGSKSCLYPYVVMELVQGLRLYEWLKVQPRTSRDVLRVLVQLAGALASAHARGVIHRDVKGDNIRVTSEGRAVLLDWGSCWKADGRALTDSPAPPGTSAYRPPEQRDFVYRFRMDTEARWKSHPSDDLYALGVTLYRLVTGAYPPPCTDGAGVIEREVPPPTQRATVCVELEKIILRLLSDVPKDRGTAEQLVRECTVLVESNGEGLDQHIRSTASALQTESGPPSSDGQNDVPASGSSGTEPSRHPPSSRSSSTHGDCRRRQGLPPWLTQAAASALGTGVVVALAALLITLPTPQVQPALSPTPWLAAPEEVARELTPDAGVAEEALASVQDVSGAVPPSFLAFGRPMPKTPLPGQRTPPCLRGEKEINGGCWLGPLEDERPPCGDTLYDYQGKCYHALGPVLRPPTSQEP